MISGTPIRAIDVHSHWSTKRGYPLQTEAELSRLQHTWRAERIYRSEAEMAEDFREASRASPGFLPCLCVGCYDLREVNPFA